MMPERTYPKVFDIQDVDMNVDLSHLVEVPAFIPLPPEPKTDRVALIDWESKHGQIFDANNVSDWMDDQGNLWTYTG